jgi:ISXO2-like transposase domain
VTLRSPLRAVKKSATWRGMLAGGQHQVSMVHRIREAMRGDDLTPFGLDGGAVEVDETFIGHNKTIKPKGEKRGRGYRHKNKVLSLVENSGQARSVVINDMKATTIAPIVRANTRSRSPFND